MSGSRLGRGRIGRLVLFGCGAVVMVFIVFLYRSTTNEMARLKDVHVKCAQQQEALAAQLQVIYEYKVQLEKTLSDEKSANAAAKEELQQKATRERSLRDKDSLEAMQRFNSLQQHYKLLQTEHQDLKDDCKKKEDRALQNAKDLESKLHDLRIEQKKADEEKRTLETLKIKYMELTQKKDELEERLNSLLKTVSNNNGNVERLQKQNIQLQRELEETKKSPHFSVGGVKVESSQVLPRHVYEVNRNNNNVDNDKPQVIENNAVHVIRPSSQLQVETSASKPEKVGPLPSESSSKPSRDRFPSNNNKSPSNVKLPLGVPPIPRLIERKDEIEPQELTKKRQQESVGQVPPLKAEIAAAAPDDAEGKLPKFGGAANDNKPAQKNGQPNGMRHEADGWYKLKPGVQEVGDPHHIEKSGFENLGGNEDVEQYDDYNYKEPENKNGDLHLEEGEDEREDEEDYMHNNINAVKHE